MDPVLASYEEVPYHDDPIFQTHPDALATPAFLAGMSPAPVENCRVMEIGCGTGGNLIAMAASLPQSRFYGIDLSPRQIAAGQKIAAELGLTNLELRVADVRDFDCEEMDYLLCHGVYSWCPPDAQEAIWSLFARRLAPQGVAYLSYNALPGWRSLSRLRDILLWGGRGAGDLLTRVRAGQRFLQVVAQVAGFLEGGYAEELRDGIQKLGTLLEEDIGHDFMGTFNQPQEFKALALRAADHGLQYLGESCRQIDLADVPPSLRRWAPTRIDGEQILDYIRKTTFRRTLFCRAGVTLAEPRASQLSQLRLNTLSEPLSDSPDVAGPGEEGFRCEFGTLTTDSPVEKAILVHLHHEWPRTLDLEELGNAVRIRIGETGDDRVVQAALHCYQQNMLALHVHAPRFTLRVGDRPAASPLARLQAARTTRVTNQRHRSIALNAFELAVLARLDGTRDQGTLMEELASSGSFTIEKGGRTVSDARELRPLVEAALGPTLARLARAALLVA
jgi:SAM-dependent methyltransferase/methyltransferase-like protein